VNCSGNGGFIIKMDGDLDAKLNTGEPVVEFKKDSQVNISTNTKGDVTVVYPNVSMVSNVELQYRTLRVDEELLVLEEEEFKDSTLKGRVEVLADEEDELDFSRFQNSWSSSDLLTTESASNVCIHAPSSKVHLWVKNMKKGLMYSKLPLERRDPEAYEKEQAELKKKKMRETDPFKLAMEVAKRTEKN